MIFLKKRRLRQKADNCCYRGQKMDTASVSLQCDERIEAFTQALKNIVALVQLPHSLVRIYSLVRVYILLPMMIINYKQVKQNINKLIISCRKTCPEREKCTEYFCGVSKQIRENLSLLFDKSQEKYSPIRPFRPFLKNAVYEWDDFVVDCEIASDKDIHALVNQIADAV